MPTSTLLYIIQSESEIPAQIVPNTAYYILGRKEVRIYDNMRVCSIFTMGENAVASAQSDIEKRIEVCENKINKVFKYLTSFGGEEDEGRN